MDCTVAGQEWRRQVGRHKHLFEGVALEAAALHSFPCLRWAWAPSSGLWCSDGALLVLCWCSVHECAVEQGTSSA